MPFPHGLLDGASDVGSVEPEPAPETQRGGWLPQYQRGEREQRGLAWKKKRDDTLERVQRAYALATGEALPGDATKAVAAAVRPHVAESYDTALPPVAAIDWAGLLEDARAIEVLLAAYQRAVDDEEAAIVLLLS